MRETSTGALQPIEEISKAVHEAGAMLLLDTVTSLGGVEVNVDSWGVDACYSGTQKCLSCPPGLSPVTFSPAAEQAIATRMTKVQSWYPGHEHGAAVLGQRAAVIITLRRST